MAPKPPALSPTMASPVRDGDDSRRRLARRVHKRRQDSSPAFQFPERLRDDDTDTAAGGHGARHQDPAEPFNLNQSLFGLIANTAGSRGVNFNERSEYNSSSSSSEAGDDNEEDLSKTTILQPREKTRTRSKRKLLQSLPALPKRFSRKHESRTAGPSLDGQHDDDDDDEDGEDPLKPVITLTKEFSGTASIMGRMLEAQAESEALRPSFEEQRQTQSLDKGDETTLLERRLKAIFEFDEAEQIIEGR